MDRVDIMGDVLIAWRAFKAGHDLKSPKLTCCDVTLELYRALQAFDDWLEAEMLAAHNAINRGEKR